jgi:hypothetical protein
MAVQSDGHFFYIALKQYTFDLTFITKTKNYKELHVLILK